MDYEVFISERISQFRQKKDVSARDMSLSIGQNSNYINKIENKKSLPSLPALFYICEYFEITPQEFFDEGNKYPQQLKDIVEDLKLLGDNELAGLAVVIKSMADKKK